MLSMLLSLGLLGLIFAAGVKILRVLFSWVKEQLLSRLKKKNVKKTSMISMDKIIDECKNTMSFDDLENLKTKGDFCFADLDENDNVIDIEMVKDKNASLDKDVEALLTDERMIVIEN